MTAWTIRSNRAIGRSRPTPSGLLIHDAVTNILKNVSQCPMVPPTCAPTQKLSRTRFGFVVGGLLARNGFKARPLRAHKCTAHFNER